MLFSNPEIPEDIYQPQLQQPIGKTSILILTADNTEDLEFFYPYYRFIEAGFTVDVATPDGKFKGKQGLGLKETKKISDIHDASYDLLYIPGGKAPAKLKGNEDALNLVKQFAVANKPIAAICHGPQLLAAANVIEGCRIAAWPEVKDELAKAGATFANEETVVDGQFITARWPADLPSHVKRTLHVLATSGNRTSSPSKFAA
jgi:protease I